MTLDAVAREAGTTRPTIYRRWPTKAELTTAAIADLVSRDVMEEIEDPRADLVRILTAIRRALILEGRASLIGGIFTEIDHNPHFVELFRERIVHPRQQQLADAFQRGKARGEVRSDLDVPVIISLLMGTVPAMYMDGGPVPDDWAVRVVDAIWPSVAASREPKDGCEP